MIALMGLPFMAMSQTPLTKANASGVETKPRQARPNTPSLEAIYVEIVVTYNDKEGQSVKIEHAPNVFESVTDKESLEQLKSLSGKTYKNVPEAMSSLASMQYKFISNYQVPSKDGNSAHLVFEKRTLSKAAKEEIREKQAAGRE